MGSSFAKKKRAAARLSIATCSAVAESRAPNARPLTTLIPNVRKYSGVTMFVKTRRAFGGWGGEPGTSSGRAFPRELTGMFLEQDADDTTGRLVNRSIR